MYASQKHAPATTSVATAMTSASERPCQRLPNQSLKRAALTAA
jgi:hypothetical protein